MRMAGSSGGVVLRAPDGSGDEIDVEIEDLAYGGEGGRYLYITESATGSILRAEMPFPGRAMYSHT